MRPMHDSHNSCQRGCKRWYDRWSGSTVKFVKLLYYFYRHIKKSLHTEGIWGISSSITYYFIMGFIPFLIFVVNIALFFTAMQMDVVVSLVYTYFPERVASVLETNIQRIVAQQNNLWLWMSLLASAYSFQSGLEILVRATDYAGYLNRHQNKTKKNFMSFFVSMKSLVFSIGLVLAIVLSLGVMIIENTFIRSLKQTLLLPEIFLNSWYWVSYFLPFVVLILFLTIFYLLAPHSYTPKLSHAVIAASLVTVLWLAATGVYSWLLLLIPSIGESYGPLFGLFVLFLWFRYITYIIIIGICFLKAWDNLRRRLDAVKPSSALP